MLSFRWTAEYVPSAGYQPSPPELRLYVTGLPPLAIAAVSNAAWQTVDDHIEEGTDPRTEKEDERVQDGVENLIAQHGGRKLALRRR